MTAALPKDSKLITTHAELLLYDVSSYYDYLCAIGRREDHPARFITLKDQRFRDIQLQHLFTANELEALINYKERYRHLDYRNKALTSLLIYQGLHPQEMAALEITDLDLHAAQVFIRATPKTNSRTLSLKAIQILINTGIHHCHKTEAFNG